MEAKLETGEIPIPIRDDFKAARVGLYAVRRGDNITRYWVHDFKQGETLEFSADQRDEAVETYEQMRQREV